MQTSLIEVKPSGKNWGVYVDGHLIAESASDVDCDLFAERLARLAKNATVDHHPELRKPRR
jgi:hypothetical protein